MQADTSAVDPTAMVDALSALKDEVVDAVEEARQRLELDRRMDESPWLVLGVAAGAGFILGGGLWPVLKPVLKAAGRTALTPTNLVALAAAVSALRAAQARNARSAAPAAAAGAGEDPVIVPAR